MRVECSGPLHPPSEEGTELLLVEKGLLPQEMQDCVTEGKKNAFFRDIKYLLKRIWGQEKSKYGILMRTCGIWENSTDEPICTADVETQR